MSILTGVIDDFRWLFTEWLPGILSGNKVRVRTIQTGDPKFDALTDIVREQEMGFQIEPEQLWQIEQAIFAEHDEHEKWRLHHWYYFGWYYTKVLEIDGRYYFIGDFEVEPPMPSYLNAKDGSPGEPEFERRRRFLRYAIWAKLEKMGHKLPVGTEMSTHFGELGIGQRSERVPVGFARMKVVISWKKS